MNNKPKILISFSGGRTSAMMTWWMQNIWKRRDDYEMIVVFSNTGKEREETLEFVRQCDRYFGFKTIWVEPVILLLKIINKRKCLFTTYQWDRIVRHLKKTGVSDDRINRIENRPIGNSFKVVNFETASRKGQPFEQAIKKYGIPNQSFPHCTRVLKAEPIKLFAKSIKWRKYFTAIGIRKDEPQRLNWVRAKTERFIYPLALDSPTTKSDVNLFWSKQPFDLNLKSYEGNCDMCWKKAARKLMTLAVDNPEMYKWWEEMEKTYEQYTPPSRTEKSKPPYRFYRNATTIGEIIEDSKLPFERAVDESKDIDMFKQMAFWDIELDSNTGCTESCEPF